MTKIQRQVVDGHLARYDFSVDLLKEEEARVDAGKTDYFGLLARRHQAAVRAAIELDRFIRQHTN